MGAASDGRTGHAVVVGGSVCGMMAARVLAEHFERVTILERDTPPDEPGHRRGTPQARHAHAQLERGLQVMEGLFPGLTAELRARGACSAPIGEGFRVSFPPGWILGAPLEMLMVSRALLEWTMRRRVREDPRVRSVDGVQVRELLAGAGGVAGVRVEAREPVAGLEVGPEGELRADLVVDASGRTSSAPRWLLDLGYEAPPELVVDSHIGYATRLFEPPPGWSAGWRGLLVQAAAPERPCGGGLFTIEGGVWQVSLFGGSGRYPPTDEEGFLAFARELREPDIHEAIRGARPVSGIHGFREAVNRWRRFERVALPDGLVVLGDAVCTFNPLYGQGMTVAAVGVDRLRRCLERRRGSRRGLAGLPREFARGLAWEIRVPWLLATSEDMRFEGVEGGSRGLVTRVMHAYLDRLQRLLVCRPEICRVFMDVVHMVASPAVLFKPGILGPVLFDPAARALPAGGQTIMRRETSGR